MAYPSPSTYSSQTVNFIGNPQSRGAGQSTDQRFVNCFPEVIYDGADKKTYHLQQRAGLVFNTSVSSGVGRGIYYYDGHLYSAVGNQLYKDGVAFQTLGSSTGQVGFTEFEGLVKYLIVLDGVKGWIINAAAAISQITDVDFPTPHVPFPAFMDGYLFVTPVGTADIYNCLLNDPTNWSAGNFITAEMYPDAIVALVRQANYVCAIGTKTCEFFYDAGNSTGSPLARNTATFQQMGTPAPNTVIQNESVIMFVGQSSTGGRTVWALKDFQPNEIAIEPVRRSLDAEGTNISNAVAFSVRSMGHKFFVIQLTSITWVFDYEEQLWHEWAAADGSSRFNALYATDHPSGSAYLLDATLGDTYKFQDSVANDTLVAAVPIPITSTVVTDKVDLDTLHRKFGNQLTLLCDKIPTGSVSCNVSWSDDDYETWSTARTIPLNTNMPCLVQLGYFRRRAFKIVYAGGQVWRLEGFILDYNMGSK